MQNANSDTVNRQLIHPLESVFRVAEVYRQNVASGSLMFFETFLLTACRSPLTLGEIARAMGVPLGIVSAALTDLGEGSARFPKNFGPPPQLLARVAHPADARSKFAALTPKGALLAAEMATALGHRGEL